MAPAFSCPYDFCSQICSTWNWENKRKRGGITSKCSDISKPEEYFSVCRRRSFALFFSGGEDENVVRQHVGDYGPWPPQFREKKIYCGLAGAAIVSLSKENYNDDGFFSSHSSPSPANFKLTSLPGQRTLHHLILSLEASTTFLFSEFVDLKTFSSGRSVVALPWVQETTSDFEIENSRHWLNDMQTPGINLWCSWFLKHIRSTTCPAAAMEWWRRGRSEEGCAKIWTRKLEGNQGLWAFTCKALCSSDKGKGGPPQVHPLKPYLTWLLNTDRNTGLCFLHFTFLRLKEIVWHCCRIDPWEVTDNLAKRTIQLLAGVTMIVKQPSQIQCKR